MSSASASVSASASSTWADEDALSGEGVAALIGGAETKMGHRGTQDEGLSRPASSIRDGFAARLKSLRVSHGATLGRPQMTTAEFAALLGVEAGRYRRYERAETEPPFWLLAAIRRITGVSVDWLLDGCEQLPI
jgi:hypothetical protein